MTEILDRPIEKQLIDTESSSSELKAQAFGSLVELKLNNADFAQILIALAKQSAKATSIRESQFDEYVKASRFLK